MEPAKIDWKDSTFVEDEVYEHINAPKWVDFSAPEEAVDDPAWFCRPDCKHPKTADEFLDYSPISKVKLSKSADVSEKKIVPLGNKNLRDACMKRRGIAQSSNLSMSDPKFNKDCENLNPNLSSPLYHHANAIKAAIKFSTGKKKLVDNLLHNENAPKLKSTLSARNLFAGGDILNQITEFCKDLKRMATKGRERENVGNLNVKTEGSESQVSCDLVRKKKEREPLLEMGKEIYEGTEKASSVKEKLRRKKRFDEAENIPLTLNLKNVKRKGEESSLPIRTCPPSPQCFSATRAPTKTPLSKTSKSRFMEREILQELEQNKESIQKEEPADKGRNVSTIEGRETRTLDIFWFLKPCTFST